MAKAILEFDLNDPEDMDLHKKVLTARNVYSVLWDYDQWLRGIIKYEEREKHPSMEEVREKFHELLDQHEVTLE